MDRIPRWAQPQNDRERDVEEYFIRRVKAIGGKSFKWRSPAQRSVPDRIVMHPKFHGRTLYVELKAPGKKSTEAQEKIQQEIIDLGHPVFELDSKQKVDEFIEDVCRLYAIEGAK